MDQFIEPLDYLRFIFALVLVLLFIWGGAWLLKRGMNLHINKTLGGGQQKLQICEILSIDGRNKLVRMQYAGKDYVVILGQHFAMRLFPAVHPHTDHAADEDSSLSLMQESLSRAPEPIMDQEERTILSTMRASPRFPHSRD